MKRASKATSASKWFDALPKKVGIDFLENLNRVRAPLSARRLWDHVLIQPDKKKLGGSPARAFAECGGTIGMWRKLQGGTQPSAIVEIAHRLNFIDDHKYGWLLREIGETPDVKVKKTKPVT